MDEITHRSVELPGLRMHVAECGSGPAVLLCHGFPELWYSWRHQLVALAQAGYHAIAPDMRGYGGTDAPEAVDAYTILHVTGDMVVLLDALHIDAAVVAGHDWGAPVAWHCALLRPDRFRGVIGLSVPFNARRAGTAPPSSFWARRGDAMFYQAYFQEPGVAEADLGADPRITHRRLLVGASGDGASGSRHVLVTVSRARALRRLQMATMTVIGSPVPRT